MIILMIKMVMIMVMVRIRIMTVTMMMMIYIISYYKNNEYSHVSLSSEYYSISEYISQMLKVVTTNMSRKECFLPLVYSQFA